MCACMRACVNVHAKLLLSGPNLCNPVDCSPPGSSVHEILQARILECVALPCSRGSSRPRAWTHISHGPALLANSSTAELPGKLAYVIYLLKTNLWFLIIFKKKDLCVYCVKAVQTLPHLLLWIHFQILSLLCYIHQPWQMAFKVCGPSGSVCMQFLCWEHTSSASPDLTNMSPLFTCALEGAGSQCSPKAPWTSPS